VATHPLRGVCQRRAQRLERSRLQAALHLRPALFDRVQVRRVRRHLQDSVPCTFDRGANVSPVMEAYVVLEDQGVRGQTREQSCGHPAQERVPDHRGPATSPARSRHPSRSPPTTVEWPVRAFGRCSRRRCPTGARPRASVIDWFTPISPTETSLVASIALI